VAEKETQVRITVIGEALIDIVQSADGRIEYAGGSPMNVAFGLGRLGDSVALLTSLGGDDRGDSIAAHLDTAGVELIEGSRFAPRTSTATATLDAAGAATYDFQIGWALPEDVRLSDADIIHTGSIAAFLHPGADVVVQLLRDNRAGSVVTFDPNIRTSLLHDRAAAFAQYEQIAEMAHVLKMSDEDAEWLYPGASLDEVIDRVLALGPAVAAITRGGEGALLATTDHRFEAPGVPVTVADTIGAGDSFMAALIHSVAELLASGATAADVASGAAVSAAELERIGRFCVTCAAITVSRAGANPPWASEV
jgi:fructokinase